LVLPEIADQAKGLISTSSPIGRGLLGKKEGDRVKIAIPVGEKRFEVLELTTLHDKKNPD
jgi:transcription elongation factor GreA